MRSTEISYSAYEATVFTDRKLIREFSRWRAFSATNRSGRLVITLDEYIRRKATCCEYADTHERDQDIRILHEISDVPPRSNSGGGTSGPVSAAQSVSVLPNSATARRVGR